jgi:predicted sulfurtransferase
MVLSRVFDIRTQRECLVTYTFGFWFQVVVDVRNSYEIRVGKFKRAIDPQTDSFRQFPAWVEENLVDGSRSGISSDINGGQPVRSRDDESAESSSDGSTEPRSPRRIAMYCTGGIRCEKATSYLVDHGFDEVCVLRGNGTIPGTCTRARF